VAVVESFAPIVGRGARALIVGSMPGVRSLEAGQYYAHPQNAFWPILGTVCGFDPALPYAERTRRLRSCGLALWDVLQQCDRDGSLDSAIIADSVRVNDFAALLRRHKGIEAVLCNGGMAFEKFERLVRPGLMAAGMRLQVVKMPSTSPANAAMSRPRKLAIWRRELSALGF